MAQLIVADAWDRKKDIIHKLYITENRFLEGENGVIQLMKEQHNFSATKAQYENRLRKWGFRKYSKGTEPKDWQIISRKFASAKAKVAKIGKEPRLYHLGKLVTPKVLRTRGFMTMLEQKALEQMPSPKTPPDFTICMPSPPPMVENGLPFVALQGFLEGIFGHSRRKDIPSESLTKLFPEAWSQGVVSANIRALLPSSAMNMDLSALAGGCHGVQQVSQVQILSFLSYLVSNNFPGTSDGASLYTWLKEVGTLDFLGDLIHTVHPSTEALVEKVFRLAVEAEDLTVVQYFLSRGVYPNGPPCRFEQLPDPITPLEYACIAGNTALAEVLLSHGAEVQEPDEGWNNSLLVLAIIGWNTRRILQDLESRKVQEIGEDLGTVSNGKNNIRQGYNNIESFVSLLGKLVDLGAKVNISTPPNFAAWTPRVANPRLFALYERHTPLTAASKYNDERVVRFLLDRGANVQFPTSRGLSALHECLGGLWTWKEKHLSLQVVESATKRKKTLEVARILLEAGAKVDERATSKSWDGMDMTVWPESLATTSTHDPNILTLLLDYGATPTERSVEFALGLLPWGCFNLFRRLIDGGAPVSNRSMSLVIMAVNRNDRQWLDYMLAAEKNPQVKLELLTKAMTLSNSNAVSNAVSEQVGEYIGPLQNYLQNDLLAFLAVFCSRASAGLVSRLVPYEILWLVGGHVIREAIVRGNFDTAHLLINAGLDVNVVVSNDTALAAAIRARHLPLIAHLKAAGAMPSVEGGTCKCTLKSCASALVAAAEVGDLDTITDLINGGADINSRGTFSSSLDNLHRRLSPWEYSYNSSKLFQDPCRCVTPLTAALLRGRESLALTLLRMGAGVDNDPSSKSRQISPLTAAMEGQCNEETCGELLKYGASPLDRSAIRMACQRGQSSLKLLAVSMTADVGHGGYFGSLLLDAVLRSAECEWSDDYNCTGSSYCQDCLGVIQLILDKNMAIINGGESIRAEIPSPLYYALPDTDMDEDEDEDEDKDGYCNLNLLVALLRAGVDPNAAMWDGNGKKWSPLVFAARTGSREAISLLLDAGACATGNDWHGHHTPLEVCVAHGNVEVMKLLLKHGASTEPSSSSMMTVLQHALDLDMKIPPDDRLEVVEILLEHGANPNTTSYNERSTPLLLATDHGHFGIVSLLLSHGADPNYTCESTPLQRAAREGHIDIASLLISHGANINAPAYRHFGATALQYAAMKGYLAIAELLLDKGADVNAPAAEIDGRTALEGAAEHGRIDMCQLLLNAGARMTGEGYHEAFERALERATKNGHRATRRLLERRLVESL